MFQKKLAQYAQLLIKVGVNLQPGQTLVIRSPVECADLVRLCAEEAYHCGCREVIVDWRDDVLERQRYLYAADEVFDEYPQRDFISYDIGLGENAALLEFYVSGPELMKGVDPQRIIRARTAKMKSVHGVYQRIYNKTAVQCTASPPICSWAKKVFPELPEKEAMAALWEKVFQTLRIDGTHDAVAAWNARFAQMQQQAKRLDALNLKYLRYRNKLGTDLTIELPADHTWHTCLSNRRGQPYAMNMPSEEIYTVPCRNGVNGTVYGSIPLVYQGCLIRGLCLRFENGRVVEASADEGDDKLKALIAFDEGSRHLGEVALVPNSSPIRKMGMLFYNPLYDENASCHLALGMGIGECIRGGETMSQDQLSACGVNFSQIHIDFMIGTDDLSIIGTDYNGNAIPIFSNGNFSKDFCAVEI